MYENGKHIRATVVLDVEFYIDSVTEPEDVFNCMYVGSDHGHIFMSKVIHTAITKNEDIVKNNSWKFLLELLL